MAVEFREITEDEALAAIANRKDNERIHCFAGAPPCFIGADWDVSEVRDFIRGSADRAWIDHMIQHDLAVVKDGKIRCFEVPHPDRETPNDR